jgi:hypothetical protein
MESYSDNILFPQFIILFPQERYVVPTSGPQHTILIPQHIILFPQCIILFPQYIILFPQHIILFPQYIILASVVRLSVRPSLTFHSKTFSSETTGSIRTKLGHNSPWVVPFQFVSGKSGFDPSWRKRRT